MVSLVALFLAAQFPLLFQLFEFHDTLFCFVALMLASFSLLSLPRDLPSTVQISPEARQRGDASPFSSGTLSGTASPKPESKLAGTRQRRSEFFSGRT